MLFKYICLPQLQDRLIGRLLLRRLFGPSPSFSDHAAVHQGVHQELFIMIRSLFSDQLIRKLRPGDRLDHLLKDRLAVIEKDLVILIREHETMYEIMCGRKSSVQI